MRNNWSSNRADVRRPVPCMAAHITSLFIVILISNAELIVKSINAWHGQLYRSMWNIEPQEQHSAIFAASHSTPSISLCLVKAEDLANICICKWVCACILHSFGERLESMPQNGCIHFASSMAAPHPWGEWQENFPSNAPFLFAPVIISTSAISLTKQSNGHIFSSLCRVCAIFAPSLRRSICQANISTRTHSATSILNKPHFVRNFRMHSHILMELKCIGLGKCRDDREEEMELDLNRTVPPMMACGSLVSRS